MAIENLQDLFLFMLGDAYCAEQTIVTKLQGLAEKVQNAQLRTALETHVMETQEHVTRLEQAFAALGATARGDECPGVEGVTEQAEELVQEVEDADTRDAVMLAAAQAIEHYEISRYGTLIAWADELGHPELAKLLQQTLDEEKATDAKLSQLAESRLNRRAAA